MPDVTFRQKAIVLVLLVLQNASVVLMTRYSKGVLGETFLASTTVVSVEVVKFIIAACAVYMNKGDSYLNTQPWPISQKLYYLVRYSGWSWVPAACYFVQNSLQYTALENLPAPVYAVLQQLKIFSAAIFSFVLLSKRFDARQWRALLLLIAGGILIQYHTFDESSTSSSTNNVDPIKGTAAILTIVGLSGFAGVMTQLLLQSKSDTKQLSLWDRNTQFAFWSIIIGMINIGYDYEYMQNNGGFFGGWTINTVILVFLWTSGGILVAITIKYTDVIIKGFASAISLVCISVLGYALLGDDLGLIFCIGAFVVVIATFNYNDKNKPLPKPPIPDTQNDDVIVVDVKDVRHESEIEPLTKARNN